MEKFSCQRGIVDKTDLAILENLQADASRSLGELAEAVHLSPTPCWRRVQRLRESGVITGQVTLCDPQQLDLRVTAFVFIKAATHSEDWMVRFVAGARELPEIVEIHRMAGDIDYLLKVYLPDIAAYDRFYKKTHPRRRSAGHQRELLDGNREIHDGIAGRASAVEGARTDHVNFRTRRR